MKTKGVILIAIFSLIAGIFSGIIITSVLLQESEVESQLNNDLQIQIIELKNQLNKSNLSNQGWYEECIEYEIITYDRILVSMGGKGVVGIELSYNPYFHNRPSPSNKPYELKSSRNETICVKWILVKNTSFGG